MAIEDDTRVVCFLADAKQRSSGSTRATLTSDGRPPTSHLNSNQAWFLNQVEVARRRGEKIRFGIGKGAKVIELATFKSKTTDKRHPNRQGNI